MNDSAQESTRREIDFCMFIVYRLAERWRQSPQGVYQTLSRIGAIEEYIIPFYDVLHTLGGEYLADDVTEYARKRGVAV